MSTANRIISGPYSFAELVSILWPGVENPRQMLIQAKDRGEVIEQRRHFEPSKICRRKAEFYILARQVPLSLSGEAT